MQPWKNLQICDFKEASESPLRPYSGEGSRRLSDGGNRRDWFPKGLGAIPTPIENHTGRDAYECKNFLEKQDEIV